MDDGCQIVRACVCFEGAEHEPLRAGSGAQVGDAVPSGTGMDDVGFEPSEGGADCLVVGFEDLVLEVPWAQRPEDGDGFGDAERQIEADDGSCQGGRHHRIEVAHLSECGPRVTAQARELSLDETLAQESRVGLRFLAGPDFRERIRAQVIEKDHQPQWRPPTLSPLHTSHVEQHFAPLGERELILSERKRDRVRATRLWVGL